MADYSVLMSVYKKEKPEYLNVRGKIGPFGRTQRWNVVSVSDLPSELQNLDTTAWNPIVIK